VQGLWDLQQPDTYLHAVATETGLHLEEYLNELVERPPLASLTDGTALTAVLARGATQGQGQLVCAVTLVTIAPKLA
jgi:hypothetical protein